MSKARSRPPLAMPVPSRRNPVQLSDAAKVRLDHVKQACDLSTYNDAIIFLYREWKRGHKSMAGAFAGIGPFERDETEDPHRVPR